MAVITPSRPETATDILGSKFCSLPAYEEIIGELDPLTRERLKRIPFSPEQLAHCSHTGVLFPLAHSLSQVHSRFRKLLRIIDQEVNVLEQGFFTEIPEPGWHLMLMAPPGESLGLTFQEQEGLLTHGTKTASAATAVTGTLLHASLTERRLLASSLVRTASEVRDPKQPGVRRHLAVGDFVGSKIRLIPYQDKKRFSTMGLAVELVPAAT